jgi:hypothetical protein
MKLSEILLEQFNEAALKKMLDHFIVRINNVSIVTVADFKNWLDPETMKLKAEVKTMKMFAEHPSVELEWPFEKEVSSVFYLETLGNNEGDGIIITNFKNLPYAKKFEFGDVEIKSFEGINKNEQLRELNFADAKCHCGLLSLLKVKSLESIFTWSGVDKNLSKAFDIIKKNLDEGRDIADCMDELIEAGLKEYAKL